MIKEGEMRREKIKKKGDFSRWLIVVVGVVEGGSRGNVREKEMGNGDKVVVRW